MVVIVLSSLGFLSATVFAHPTVAEVEEMGGLMHFPNDADFVLRSFYPMFVPLEDKLTTNNPAVLDTKHKVRSPLS